MTLRLSTKHSVSIWFSRVQYADISINKLKPLHCGLNQIFELNFEFASIEVREKQFYMTVIISTKYSVCTRFSRVQDADISINKLKPLHCAFNQIFELSFNKLAIIEVRKKQFYMTVKLLSKHSVSIRFNRVQYADI